MPCQRIPAMLAWAALLLLCSNLQAAGAAPDPLSLISPGLTASGLCPLITSSPQAAINAIARGSIAAVTSDTQADYAKALGAAVGAASSNGCINEVFEVVNQAIIQGGYPTEVVVGRALALGSAGGADQVLAKATAVVMCKGGESASACARAWAQAIQLDTNGCLVLVQAFAQAKAQCGPGFATAQVQATVFKEPLGTCKAPGLTTGPRTDDDDDDSDGVYSGRRMLRGSR